MTMAESTRMAPTERSIPAVRMISVCAIAMIPTTVTCFRMSDNVLAARKLLGTRKVAMKPKIATLASSISVGMVVGCVRRKLRAFSTRVSVSSSNWATDLSASFSCDSKSDMVFVGEVVGWSRTNVHLDGNLHLNLNRVVFRRGVNLSVG